MMGYEGHYFGAGGMWLFWILILAAIIFLIQYVAKVNSNNTATKNETSEDILKRRFARGEITEEEYHHMLDTLK